MVLPKKQSHLGSRMGIVSATSVNHQDRGTTTLFVLSNHRRNCLFLKQHRLFTACFGLVSVLIYRAWIVVLEWNSWIDIDSPKNMVLVKDVVSRNAATKLRMSDYLAPRNNNDSSTNNIDNASLAEVMDERQELLSLLNDARIETDDATDIMQFPTWREVTDLYGPKPIILGLERCEVFREQVGLHHRFVGVAGNFNSGTTAFALSLQSNCRFPHRNESSSQQFSNDKVSNVHGMLSQVPWAKHKMAIYKYNHTILSTVPKDHVLPVVLVRDPFYWMQSMCKQGYGVRWDHDSTKHCPNLIPNGFDKRRFGKRLAHSNITSMRVWMGPNPTVGPSWDSLIHYWNAWYESYLNASWPRLIIRFEDTLFHPKQVMNEVCHCAGGELFQPFQFLLDEAKWNHKHQQNNMITAMIRYGTEKGRYHNMTANDLAFAHRTLNPTLLEAFCYKMPRD
jgi:hypothetical protein